ncbi:MAG: hypothetical protein ACYDEE_01680 [Ignavibacteriaceae bacterium]
MNEQTALDDIKFIKKIIDDSKRTTIDNGMGYVFWGIIVTIGLLSNYIMVLLNIKISFIWVWVILIGFGWAYSIISYFSRKSKPRIRTYAGNLLRSIWLSCGIAMTLVGFIGVFSGAIDGDFVSPIISVILGVGFMLSGFVYDLKWVRNLSIGWWIGATVMFVYPGLHSILIMGFMMLAFQVTPGLIIYNKFKKEITIQK